MLFLFSFSDIIDKLSYLDKEYLGVFSDECDLVYNDQFNYDRSYWVGVEDWNGNGGANSFFSIDLKVQVHINKITLRNSANSQWNDR